MTDLDDPPPEITLNHLGIGDVDIDINKLATMVETWCKEYLDQHMKEIQKTLDDQDISIQKILDEFYQGVLKYLKAGLIVSINMGLVGFGWFLHSALGNM